MNDGLIQDARVRDLATEIEHSPGVVLELDAHEALTVVAVVQLALRHPGMAKPDMADLALFAHSFVQDLTAGMGPEVRRLVAEGWEGG